MFAIRTVRAIKTVAAVVGVYLIVVGAIAVAVRDQRQSFWEAYGHWLWALPAVLLGWAAIELFGAWLFNRPAIDNLSSPARIAVIVIGILAVTVVLAAVSQVANGHAP